jgi:hypothetical protein
MKYWAITHCRKLLINVIAHHWTRAPQQVMKYWAITHCKKLLINVITHNWTRAPQRVMKYWAITHCTKLLNKVIAHQWTRVPQLCYIFCCLLTFFNLPNIFMHAPDGWFVEPHNSPFLCVPWLISLMVLYNQLCLVPSSSTFVAANKSTLTETRVL